MKKRVEMAVVMFLLFFAAISPTMKGNAGENHVCNFVSAAEAATSPAELTVVFARERLIEAAFFSVKRGSEQVLNEQYFAKVMPVAMEYGMKPLASLQVTSVPNGSNKPQMVGFFEWPSLEKRVAFNRDKRFLAIKGIRDNAMSYLKESYFQVQADTLVTFRQDKLYEIYAMWMNPANAAKMNEYFGRVGKTVGEYGARFPVSFMPVNTQEGNYHPHMMGIAEWPSEEANQAFFATDTFKDAVYLRNQAVDLLDVIHAKVLIETKSTQHKP